ncbi:MAG: metallophosphoesterase [Candidatus Omnitrophota bacterium]
MLYFEAVSILAFLSVIAALFILETVLIVKFIIAKLSKGEIKIGFKTIVAHTIAFAGILCVLYGFFIEPYWIDVKTVDITTDKLENTGLKVVQISDLHCDKKVINEYKMINIINGLNPDIIVFTGDALNNSIALPRFRSVLRNLKAKIGKYAVRGNVEVIYFGGLNIFEGTDFKVLDKQSVELAKDGEEFFISGLSFAYAGKYYEVLKDIPEDKYNIFLNHYPDLIEDVKGLNVDLYLAGHTHGGQIRFPFYGALVTFSKYGKKYEAGEYHVGDTILYVNRGIGLEGGFSPRVRFLARPEITVFNIKPKLGQNSLH